MAEVTLGPEDSFLVLATDGVWDQLSNGDAVRLVHDTVKEPAMCGRRLAAEALARGSRDNVTAVVLMLGSPEEGSGGGTAERVYHAGRHKTYAAAGGAGGGGGQLGSGGGTRGVRAAPPSSVADELRDTY